MGAVDPLALHQPAATLDEIMLLIQIVAAARGKGARFCSYAHTLQVLQPTRFSAFVHRERGMICLCAKERV
jgi:hypothetical protein